MGLLAGAAVLGSIALGALSCSESSGSKSLGSGSLMGSSGSAGAEASSTQGPGGTPDSSSSSGAPDTSRVENGESPDLSGTPLIGAPTTGAVSEGASADAGSPDAAAGAPPIVELFNGRDLTGWTAYRETTQNAPGTQLSEQQAEQIFKPENGMIRVYGDALNGSTQSRHTLVTDLSYSRYKLWVEYSWGTKVFAPYADLVRYPRDAGILFHIHGDERVVWPSSIEFQIKDGSTGDIYALYARCTSLAQNGGTTFVDAAQGGTPKLVNGANGFVQHARSANFELPEWNSLELQVDGGSAVYLVNGHIVNRVSSINDRSGAAGLPISAGPVALQAEHAEVFYRNVRLQVLP